jgi:hypothetical protein
MDHFFHPWHYVPVLIALPYLGTLYLMVRQKLTGESNDDEQDANHDQ